MADPDSAESDLSSQSSLSGPSSENGMGNGEMRAKGRQRRVIQDDEDDGSAEEDEVLEDEDEDGEAEDDDEEEEEEDDELLNDPEESDVDELEDDEDEPATAAPGNARNMGGRRITLKITPNKKGAANAQASSSRAGARSSRTKAKKGKARTEAGETLDDDDGSFDEFENEDMFASLPKTARQLAKEKAEQGIDSPGSELLELPPEESKRQRMTESELALKRSELARRRRNQTEKKLEDDKIETINRLLKKQVSRTGGRAKRSNAEKDESEGEEDADKDAGEAGHGAEHYPTPQELKDRPAPYFRYVSSIRDGQLVRSSLSLPIESETGPTDGPYKRKWDEMFAQQAETVAGQ